MSTYELSDGNSEETIEAADLADARRQAEAWVRDGDWNEPEETIWIRVVISEDGEHADSVTVAIDPTEPACSGYEDHDWRAPHALVGGLLENPGVRGHGGGVTIAEACVRCGCKRTTDTWAQDRSTGEQGLTSVSYERKAYSADEIGRALCVSAPTCEPVTTSGWYEETDGRVAEYRWVQGSLVRGREAASWADVPSEPSWHAPLPSGKSRGR